MMLPTLSFKSIRSSQRHHPTEQLWRRCFSIRSQFCEAVVNAGYLSWEQMVSAACRYRLGASRQGGVIFWQIDQEERVRDGKVMYYGPDCHRLKDKAHKPTWVSYLLHRRDLQPDSPHETTHCFFGTHILRTWSCTDNTDLKGITVYKEETDLRVCIVEAEKTAVIMSDVMRQPFWEDSPPIRVSPLLERHATSTQKTAKIDLVDYLKDHG